MDICEMEKSGVLILMSDQKWKRAYLIIYELFVKTKSAKVLLHIFLGIGNVSNAQIQAIASKPEYAVVKPNADQLEPVSAEVIQHTREGRCSTMLDTIS